MGADVADRTAEIEILEASFMTDNFIQDCN